MLIKIIDFMFSLSHFLLQTCIHIYKDNILGLIEYYNLLHFVMTLDAYYKTIVTVYFFLFFFFVQ